MLRLIGSVLILAGMTTGIAANVFAADADVLQQAKDRAEIEELMWRYVRALDTSDEDAYASVYTEDGQFGTGPNATKGREALRNMIVNLEEGRSTREAAGEPATPPMYHVITNPFIEFVGEDKARMHSYWMTVFGSAGQDVSPRVAAAGRGIDELVRVNGQWLIKLRDVSPQD